MPSWAEVVGAVGVFVGGASFGFAGFAFALFATAALAFVAPPQIAVPAVLLVGDTLILLLLWEHRRHLDRAHLRTVPPFTPASLPLLVIGLVLGALLLGHLPATIGRVALALVVLSFVGRQLARGRGKRAWMGVPGRWSGPGGAALAGGVLDGWLGTGGVVIAMFLAARRLRPELFVVSILGYFIASDAIRIVTYTALGYWSTASLALYARALPPALAGYVTGILLRRWLRSERVFRGVVLGLLVTYALALIARAVFAR